MLTYNIDTSDGLTNGAHGEVIGKLEDTTNRITKFDNEKHGYEARQRNPDVTQAYPEGTPIEKVNFSFSISRSKKICHQHS